MHCIYDILLLSRTPFSIHILIFKIRAQKRNCINAENFRRVELAFSLITQFATNEEQFLGFKNTTSLRHFTHYILDTIVKRRLIYDTSSQHKERVSSIELYR